MDLKTLWDRTNDAINTIIRLDESTETGKFLQPCIEGRETIFSKLLLVFNSTFAYLHMGSHHR